MIYRTSRITQVNLWPEDFPPDVGRTISRFRIVEKIGQGGMGEVYLSGGTTLNRKVALKFLSGKFAIIPKVW